MRRAARANDGDRHVFQCKISNRRKKAGCIRIRAHQAAIRLTKNSVHRADTVAHITRIGDMIHRSHLVRHSNVAPAPHRIIAALLEISTELVGQHVTRPVFAINTKLCQPESVNYRRFGMADRIANHFGIGCHDASSPRSRSHCNSERSGRPRIVK